MKRMITWFRWKKSIVLYAVSTETYENLKYHTFSEKTLFLSVICSKCENDNEKLFKEELKTLKTLRLIKNI